MTFVNQELQVAPPESSLQVASAMSSHRDLWLFSAGNIELAELVFDSASQCPGTATRASVASARQLLYKSGNVCIDMHVQPTPGLESVVSDRAASEFEAPSPGHERHTGKPAL